MSLDPLTGSLIKTGASLFGGMMDRSSNKKEARKQRKHEAIIMRNQIQWKVADAKKAGIHPLYAMGSAPYSGSPVAVGQSNMGDRIASGVTDAIDVYQGRKGRSVDQAIQEQQLSNLQRQGDYIAEQTKASIHKRMSQQQNSMPTKYVNIVNNRDPNNPVIEQIPNPDVYELPEMVGGAMYGTSAFDEYGPKASKGVKKLLRGSKSKVRESKLWEY